MATEIKAGQASSAQDVAKQRLGTIGSAQQSDPSAQARSDAYKRSTKAQLGVHIDEKLNDAIDKIFDASVGNEIKLQELILSLAQSQATNRQAVQTDAAKRYTDLINQPQATKMSIVSMATGLSTLARFFKCNDFADMIDETANEIAATVHIRTDVNGIQDGSKELSSALEKIRTNLGTTNAAQDAAGKARTTANEADFSAPYDAYLSGGSAPAGGEKPPAPAKEKPKAISWNAFYEGMKASGVDETSISSLKKQFDSSAKLNPRGNDAELDGNAEKLALFASTKNTLTEAQQKIAATILGISPQQPASGAPTRSPAVMGMQTSQ